MSTHRGWKIFSFLGSLLLLSPLIGIIINTTQAVTSSYAQNRDLLQDPGHRRINIYDNIVGLTSLAACVYVIFFVTDLNFENMTQSEAMYAFLFPQLNGWINFFVLYAIVAFLQFYRSKRDKIIRDVNEQQGVW